jgi:hypothetical protein
MSQTVFTATLTVHFREVRNPHSAQNPLFSADKTIKASAQGEPSSEVTFRDSLQKPKKRVALIPSHLLPDTLLGGLPSFD